LKRKRDKGQIKKNNQRVLKKGEATEYPEENFYQTKNGRGEEGVLKW